MNLVTYNVFSQASIKYFMFQENLINTATIKVGCYILTYCKLYKTAKRLPYNITYFAGKKHKLVEALSMICLLTMITTVTFITNNVYFANIFYAKGMK